MVRVLTVLFRRDPSRDRQDDRIAFEGYSVLWPDGRPMATAVEAFCSIGRRLLGLGRHLAGTSERLIDLKCFPLKDRDDDLVRLPGHRVRRFCLVREGDRGRLHFLDGTPTNTVFQIGRDDEALLRWVGLSDLADGQTLWFDLAAAPSVSAAPEFGPHHLTGDPLPVS